MPQALVIILLMVLGAILGSLFIHHLTNTRSTDHNLLLNWALVGLFMLVICQKADYYVALIVPLVGGATLVLFAGAALLAIADDHPHTSLPGRE